MKKRIMIALIIYFLISFSSLYKISSMPGPGKISLQQDLSVLFLEYFLLIVTIITLLYTILDFTFSRGRAPFLIGIVFSSISLVSLYLYWEVIISIWFKFLNG